MKKIYLFLFVSLFTFSLTAQVDVTFQVDMSDQTVSSAGVFVSGDWMANASVGSDWAEPGSVTEVQLTDDNGDDVYTLTVTLMNPGPYAYKYSNGSGWPNGEAGGTDDNFQADLSACGVDNGFGGYNRTMDVPNEASYALTAYKFNTCEESSIISSTEELVDFGAVTVRPNPFTSTATISFGNPNNEVHNLLISDITGKTVATYNNIRGTQFEINRGELINGIYFATLQDEAGNAVTKKLMVK